MHFLRLRWYVDWLTFSGEVPKALSLSGLAFFAFWKRRAQFRELLSSTPSLSVDRYLRLMILACAEMVCTVPLGIYSIYINTYGVPLEPYISWENIHWGFNRFTEVPAAFWQSNGTLRAAVELSRWLYVACALLFVILFAFTEESRKTYLRVFWNTVSIIRTRKEGSAS
jgi:pheromone a factor receptor